MLEQYKNIFCIHSLDDSTAFLSPFKNIIPEAYSSITSNKDSLKVATTMLASLEAKSLIIFLGHGYSRGLYSPQFESSEKSIFLDMENGNEYFSGHDILLLSCKSAEYIRHLTTFNNAIGFGNIISSAKESSAEAEYTGHFRNLTEKDIENFNKAYLNAISNSVDLLVKGTSTFKELPIKISFFINQEINKVLKDKGKANRIEVARLLYEFRNEIEIR
ncbi:MAG: hypothetical protein ABI308_02775 [Mucilaginibacter sp.]